MLDFWCPEGGTDRSKCVLIKVPSMCCGIRTDIVGGGNSSCASYFNAMCRLHMNSYEQLWHMHKVYSGIVIQREDINNHCICAGCGEPNEYAVPNMPNGKFKCFSCRRT